MLLPTTFTEYSAAVVILMSGNSLIGFILCNFSESAFLVRPTQCTLVFPRLHYCLELQEMGKHYKHEICIYDIAHIMHD